MVYVCNSYWQYVGMYEMPLKIKEINLSLPSVALTFLLRSTGCQSHFLPLEICLSQRSEALLAEVGPWGGGGGGSWERLASTGGKKLHGRTLLHSTHSSTCLQDWTQHVVSLCVCVCVCLNSPSTTKTVQEFAKWLVATQAPCLWQHRSMHVPAWSPGCAAGSTCFWKQCLPETSHYLILNLAQTFMHPLIFFHLKWQMEHDIYIYIYIFFFFFLWGIQVGYIVHEFHFKLLIGSLVANLTVDHCSKPAVMTPFSFTKHSPLFAARGGQGQGKL